MKLIFFTTVYQQFVENNSNQSNPTSDLPEYFKPKILSFTDLITMFSELGIMIIKSGIAWLKTVPINEIPYPM